MPHLAHRPPSALRAFVAALPLALALAAAGCAGSPVAGHTSADPAPVARAYLDWVQHDISAIEADMPAITAAADTMAEGFIKTKHVATKGDPGIEDEMMARAGGIGLMDSYNTPGEPVIYAMGIPLTGGPDAAKLLETQIADAAKLHATGSAVVAVVSVAELQALGLLDRTKAAVTAIIDTHAAATDGHAFSRQDPTPVPTYTVATTITCWTLASEFVGACTRRGQTPIVLQSMTIDTTLERNKKYAGQPFHSDLHVPPVPPGLLGSEYDDGLRSLFHDIGAASWPALATACTRMARAINDGGNVYVFAQIHEPQYHHAGQLAADPKPFKMLNSPSGGIAGKPGPADFAVAYGYSWGPDDLIESSHQSFWVNPAVIRGAGRGVCWVMTTQYGLDPREIRPHEMVLDQRWQRGDALVDIPGYPIRMAPPSGAVVETLMWAMEAQVHALVAEHARRAP